MNEVEANQLMVASGSESGHSDEVSYETLQPKAYGGGSKVYFGKCETPGNVSEKIIKLDDPSGFKLEKGVEIIVMYSYTNSVSNPTYNVENTGPKNLYINQVVATNIVNYGYAGVASRYTKWAYDGTYWVWMGHGCDNDTTYNANSFSYLVLNKTTDASGLKYNTPALTIGGTSSTNHIEMDSNEIMAKSNETTPTTLYINGDGGNVIFGSSSTSRITFNNPLDDTTTYDYGETNPVVSLRWPAANTNKFHNTNIISTIGNSETANSPVLFGSSNGASFFSSGESGKVLPSVLTNKAYNTESNYITSDGAIFFITDAANDGSSYNIAFMRRNILSGVNSPYFATCDTDAATPEKVATITYANYFKLVPGVIVSVRYSVRNTATDCTLNVNGTGAKQVWYNSGVYTNSGYRVFGNANTTVTYVWDGEYWVWVSSGNVNDTTYSGLADVYVATAATTASKVGTSNGYVLKNGGKFVLRIANANSYQGAITLNINSKGAKPIYINGTASGANNYTLPAGDYDCVYQNDRYYVRTDAREQIPISATESISFGKNSSGEYGYYDALGNFQVFKKPTGNATEAQVLSGRTFSNATSTGLTGKMTNYGSVTLNSTSENGTVTLTTNAGYYSIIKVNQTNAYNAGMNFQKSVTWTESMEVYKAGTTITNAQSVNFGFDYQKIKQFKVDSIWNAAVFYLGLYSVWAAWDSDQTNNKVWGMYQLYAGNTYGKVNNGKFGLISNFNKTSSSSYTTNNNPGTAYITLTKAYEP